MLSGRIMHTFAVVAAEGVAVASAKLLMASK